MLAAQEIRPGASRGETGCKYTASQEPLKCENWIVLPKRRTMSLGLDLWHISFLPNQCLCAGRLHGASPRATEEQGLSTHRHPSCPALSEGLTPTCFKRPKQSTSGTHFTMPLRVGDHYRVCINYQLYAYLPATVCGPCLFQWTKTLS